MTSKQRIQKRAGYRPKEDNFTDVKIAVNKAYARMFGSFSWREVINRGYQKAAPGKGKS
jgi:hypothetical protein